MQRAKINKSKTVRFHITACTSHKTSGSLFPNK